ncbi:MAG: hypothetical protein U1A07_04010 [Phenylobacterium sp.]|nr:hypothetical protein [Phenylobacterium sp.]
MAFWSDVHVQPAWNRASPESRRRPRLNWRLMLAVLFNVLAWLAIVQVLRTLI